MDNSSPEHPLNNPTVLSSDLLTQFRTLPPTAFQAWLRDESRRVLVIARISHATSTNRADQRLSANISVNELACAHTILAYAHELDGIREKTIVTMFRICGEQQLPTAQAIMTPEFQSTVGVAVWSAALTFPKAYIEGLMNSAFTPIPTATQSTPTSTDAASSTSPRPVFRFCNMPACNQIVTGTTNEIGPRGSWIVGCEQDRHNVITISQGGL